MLEKAAYDAAFFEKIGEGSLLSARRVVPMLLEKLKPESVVDVGCGTGAWLSAFWDAGVSDILGIDGPYVDRQRLLIDSHRFLTADLGQPLKIPRRFDLVLSLEVAEHLPPSAAEVFLDNLTALGDRIVFSAAVPFQGGTHHVNEQWPSYWKEKFAKRDYHLVDCLRKNFWNDRDVERWYRQNMLLYVKESRLKSDLDLMEALEKSQDHCLDIVHPAVFLSPSLSALLQIIPRTVYSGIRRRFRKKLPAVSGGNGMPPGVLPGAENNASPNSRGPRP